MKRNIQLFSFILFLCFGLKLSAQEINPEVFDLINLDRKGLEEVKKLHGEGKDKEAAAALLVYYKNRTGIIHPDIDMKNIKISKDEQKYADEALEHKFFAHKGYQPSYFYGKDIDWTYWPVRDNELRWQLHRHKWFIPMGKAYLLSGDEKYAKEWVFQYMNWIKKNPLIKKGKSKEIVSAADQMKEDNQVNDDNTRYAWRPLEVSARLQDQTVQFMLFNNSKYFTPEFYTQFLVNYHKHAVHIMGNYSKQGNHLLFEAQRVLYAGIFFPEFKDAEQWRKTGIAILNKEIDTQVYSDGVQFELCPHYHLAAINIFFKALEIAKVNGYESEFPAQYLAVIEKMIEATYNFSFPNYNNPLFSDAKQAGKEEMIGYYKAWAKVFPDNEQIRYFATNGKKGKLPAYTSKGFEKSGFFMMRNGWNMGSTMMILKAGPPAFWHNQPDNGTFELFIKGRNFFPDAGSYVYAGDEKVMKWRNWFRQTRVHKTLTLNDKDIEKTDSKTRLWDVSKPTEILVTENESYKDLKHRRSVFFVNKKIFVIVDEAIGAATGNVGVHYQLCEGDVTVDTTNNLAFTNFNDENNVLMALFCDNSKNTMQEEEGWVSYEYRQKAERCAYVFNADKTNSTPVRYITVILPVKDGKEAPDIKATFNKKEFNEKGLDISVEVNKEKYNLNYSL